MRRCRGNFRPGITENALLSALNDDAVSAGIHHSMLGVLRTRVENQFLIGDELLRLLQSAPGSGVPGLERDRDVTVLHSFCALSEVVTAIVSGAVPTDSTELLDAQAQEPTAVNEALARARTHLELLQPQPQ